MLNQLEVIRNLLQPSVFNGGTIADYIIEYSKTGGLITRHLSSGRVVPYVLAKPGVGQSGSLVPPGFGSVGGIGDVAQMANPYLAAANLGVGLLNLGVSAWTAYKVHKMDKKIDGLVEGVNRIEGKVDGLTTLLESSVGHLEQLIVGNSRLLGLLADQQMQLGHALVQLRQEMHQGFGAVQAQLQSIEENREARALAEKMNLVFSVYRVCNHELSAGRTPAVADLHRLVNHSYELNSWLTVRRDEHPVRAPQRLPFVVAQALALRLEVDAREKLEEGAEARWRDVAVLRGTIETELQALSEGASIYELAAERSPLIAQYVFLHRGLGQSATMVEFPDGALVPVYPEQMLTWDDGLDEARTLLAQSTDAPPTPSLKLDSLKEHSAWQKLGGAPARGDNVPRTDVEHLLDLPKDHALPNEALRGLLLLTPTALPDAQRRVQAEVNQ